MQNEKLKNKAIIKKYVNWVNKMLNTEKYKVNEAKDDTKTVIDSIMDRTFNVLQIEHSSISSKDKEIAAENSQKATEDAKTYYSIIK